MIGVDTNVLVRLFVPVEPQRAASLAFFGKRSPADPAYVSLVVVAEFACVLRRRYKYDFDKIGQGIRWMLDSDDFVLENRDLIEGALVTAWAKGWRTADIAEPGCRVVGTREMGDRIVEEILPAYLRDNRRARTLLADGSYARTDHHDGESPLRSQMELLISTTVHRPEPPAESPPIVAPDTVFTGVTESNGAPEREKKKKKDKFKDKKGSPSPW
jgi:predicted nucleic-acid-binding protein